MIKLLIALTVMLAALSITGAIDMAEEERIAQESALDAYERFVAAHLGLIPEKECP